MEFKNLELFITLSWILILTPGPDLLYVLTRGISGGKKAGLISAFGVTAGILVHTLFAALGLSLILKTSATAFMVIKFAGAIYLIYLGVKALLSKEKFDLDTQKRIPNRKVFVQGMLTNILNPKVALFFMAFLPQFINADAMQSHETQLSLLGLLFCFFGLIFLSVLGYFAGTIGNYLLSHKNAGGIVQKIAGSIMVLLGIRLVFSER